MPFQKGQSGNPGGRRKEKPFRDALRVELAAIENGQGEEPLKPGSLRAIARALLLRAMAQDAAAKEIADRLDGKPAQALVGGDEDDEPINVLARIERVIVNSDNSNSSGVPPVT